MTPLINYSHLSTGRSLSTIEDIVQAAKERGASVVGLTDWHTVAGAPRFLAACQKAGIQGVVGATLNIQVDDALSGTVVFLAQDDIGYRNLMQLVSIAGEAGEGLALPREHSVPIARIFDKKNAFDGVLMLDGHRHSLAHTLMSSELHQGWFNTIAGMIPDAQRIGVASPGGIHPGYAKLPPERRLVTPVGLAVKKNQLSLAKAYYEDTYLNQLSEDDTVRHQHLREWYDEQSLDAPLPEAGPGLSADALRSRISTLSVYHPEIQVKGITTVNRPDFDSELDAAWAKLSASLPASKREEYHARLDSERQVIKAAGYTPYFENILYLKQWEESQGGYVMLRGSAVASLSFYALGLTHLDPVAEKLMFERFLNPERIEEPDVDIEFSHYNSFYTRLDKHLPGQIAVINDAKGVKSSDALLNMVETALTTHSALSDNDKRQYKQAINTLRRRVPTKRGNRAKPIDAWAEEIVALVRNGTALSDPERHVISAAKMMVNGRRAYSVSNSTAIIVPEGVNTWFNTYRTQKGAGDVNKVSVSKDDLAATGLIKYDLLANRFFSRAVNIANALKTDIYKEVDPESPSIARVFERRAYLGITQLSSTVGPRLADIIKPQNLRDLTALSALIRDGASDANMELAQHFARSKTSPDPALANSPLNNILGETYGLLLYEEQLLELLMQKGGFSFAEADKLRSGLKKGNSHYIDAYRDRFIQEAARQAREAGLNDADALAQAEFCYSPIENKRGRFVFSKAHALAYMELGVKLCDMKCYAPALFAAETYLDKSATHCFPEGKNGWLKSRNVSLYDLLHEWESLNLSKSRHNAQHLVAAIAGAMTRENTADTPDPDYRRDPQVIAQELKDAVQNGAMDFIMPEGFSREKLLAYIDHKMAQVPTQSRSASRSQTSPSNKTPSKPPQNGATREDGGGMDQVKQVAVPINGRRGKIDFDTEILPGALFDFLQREGVVKGLQIEKKSATQDSFRFSYIDRNGQERQRNFVGTGLRPDAVAKQNPKWMTTVTEQGSRSAYPFLGLLGHLQNEIGFMGKQQVELTPRKGLGKNQFTPLVKSFTRWLSGTQNKLYPMDIKSMTDYFEFDVATSPVIPAVSRDDRRYAYKVMMELLSESRAISPELLNEWLDEGQLLFAKTILDPRAEDPKRKVTLDTPRKGNLMTNVLAVYRPVDPHRPLYDMPLIEGAALGDRGYQKFIKKMMDDPAQAGEKNPRKVVRGNKIDFGKTTKRAPALFGGRVQPGADTLWVTEAIIDTYSFCDMQNLLSDYNQRHNADLPVSEQNAISIRSAGGAVRLFEQMLGIQALISETEQKDERGMPVYEVDFCQVKRRRSVVPLNDDRIKTGKSWLMERQFVWVGDPTSEYEQKEFKRLRAVLHAFGMSADEVKSRVVTVPVKGTSAEDRHHAYQQAASTHIKTQREQILSSDNLHTWLRGNEIDVIEQEGKLTVGVVQEEISKGPAFSTLPEEKQRALASSLKDRFEQMTGARGVGIAVDPDKGGEQDAVFMREFAHAIGLPVKTLRPLVCEKLPPALSGFVKENALKDHNDYLTLIRGLHARGDSDLADEMIRYYAQAYEPPKPHQQHNVVPLPGDTKQAVVPGNDRKIK